MSVFGNLKSDGLEETQDRLGGFAVRPTDAYLATIKMAYAGKSQHGAQSVTLILDLGTGDYTETQYVTNRNGENFFLNPNEKTKKVPLPGFAIINDICLVTTGKELFEQATDEKVVKIYDFEERKELPKNVPVLVDLLDMQVYVGIVQQTVDKNVKDDSTGEYVPTGETRDENVIEKVFHHPSKVTVVEAREAEKAGTEAKPVFFDQWVEKNKGKVRNKAKGTAPAGGGQAGRPGGAPQGGNAGTAKTTSLFKK